MYFLLRRKEYISFSRGSSWAMDRTPISWLQVDSLSLNHQGSPMYTWTLDIKRTGVLHRTCGTGFAIHTWQEREEFALFWKQTDAPWVSKALHIYGCPQVQADESCSKERTFLQISDGKPTICWRISHLVFTSAYHSPILQLYPHSEKWQAFPLSHPGWIFKSIGNSTSSC